MFIPTLSLIAIIAFSLSCTSRTRLEHERQAKLARWEQTLDSLKMVKADLQEELTASESYIASAEVHQVLRSPEEKERQLNNLNLYQEEVEAELDSVEKYILMYSDSIRMNDVRDER